MKSVRRWLKALNAPTAPVLAQTVHEAVGKAGRLPHDLSIFIRCLPDREQMRLVAEIDDGLGRPQLESQYKAALAVKGEVMQYVRIPNALTSYYSTGLWHLSRWLDDRRPPNLIRALAIGYKNFEKMGEGAQRRWAHLNTRLVAAAFGLADPALDSEIPPPHEYDDEPGRPVMTMADARVEDGIGRIRYNMPVIKQDFPLDAHIVSGETGAHEASHIIDAHIADYGPLYGDYDRAGTFMLAAQALRHSGVRRNITIDYDYGLDEQLARETGDRYKGKILPMFNAACVKILPAQTWPRHHACLKRALASACEIRPGDADIEHRVDAMRQLYRHWASDAHWLNRGFVDAVSMRAEELVKSIERQKPSKRDGTMIAFMGHYLEYVQEHRALHLREIRQGDAARDQEFAAVPADAVDGYIDAARGELNALRIGARPVMREALARCMGM